MDCSCDWVDNVNDPKFTEKILFKSVLTGERQMERTAEVFGGVLVTLSDDRFPGILKKGDR